MHLTTLAADYPIKKGLLGYSGDQTALLTQKLNDTAALGPSRKRKDQPAQPAAHQWTETRIAVRN